MWKHLGKTLADKFGIEEYGFEEGKNVGFVEMTKGKERVWEEMVKENQLQEKKLDEILETNRDFKRKLEESVVALNQSLWGLGSFFFSRTSSSTTTTTRHELLSSKRSELRSRFLQAFTG
ncbi:hypothetical protein Bca4012_008833 [Brassica carinata]